MNIKEYAAAAYSDQRTGSRGNTLEKRSSSDTTAKVSVPVMLVNRWSLLGAAANESPKSEKKHSCCDDSFLCYSVTKNARIHVQSNFVRQRLILMRARNHLYSAPSKLNSLSLVV